MLRPKGSFRLSCCSLPPDITLCYYSIYNCFRTFSLRACLLLQVVEAPAMKTADGQTDH